MKRLATYGGICFMEPIIKGITENYKDRVQKIALFDVLYTLENKKTKDNSGKYIDFFSLGLLTLLFFFENMLIRNKKTGVKELTEFLIKINKEEINLDYKGFENIARTIIETFRPPSGKRNFRKFYNWESRREEVIEYSILKASKSDIKANTQYYTLDEQGLELIFATKEYFSEFQLSINQLLLRKQLEKGEFVGALRQIDEMRIDVETIEERMKKIKYEVQRNILSEKTYERYKTLLEDINLRLTRENEEFDELQSFVNETREKLSYEVKNEKDIKAYEYIIKIHKELGEVHREHRQLLEKSIELKTATLQSAQESLYYISIDSFNFKNEITSRLFSSPLPLVSSRQLLEPFLSLEKRKAWSPLTVFSPQRIENKDYKETTNDFLEMTCNEKIGRDLEVQQRNFKFIMEIILAALDSNFETNIQNVVDYMKNKNLDYILNDILFYHFFIILHQKSPIKISMEKDDKELLLQDVIELLYDKYSTLYVIESNGIVKGNDKYSIRNMLIKLEEKSNVL